MGGGGFAPAGAALEELGEGAGAPLVSVLATAAF
jgi:hypothetical protein